MLRKLPCPSPGLDEDTVNIDLRIFPTLVDFCTAPRPAACHCAFDDRAGRWEVRCDHPGVPMAHAWGFWYAIHYCERWCGCMNANLEGLPDLQVVAAREGLGGAPGGGVRKG